MDLKNINNLYIKLLSKTGCNDFCINAVRGRSKKSEK